MRISATAVIEHDFDNGLKVKNQTRVANYDKFYQNIFPGGAVNAAGTVGRTCSAYNNETDRENLFNQTDLTYKFDPAPCGTPLLVGAEVGRQSGLSFRQDGFFNNAANPNGTRDLHGRSPLESDDLCPVIFRNSATGANNTYKLDLGAALRAGPDRDHAILRARSAACASTISTCHARTAARRRRLNRVDDLLSPRLGVIVKPSRTVVLWQLRVSYLPSAGDQFSALNPGHRHRGTGEIREPRSRREVGHLPAAAVHRRGLQSRPHQSAFPDPNNPGLFILSGRPARQGLRDRRSSATSRDSWQIVGRLRLHRRQRSSALRPPPSCRATASAWCRTTPSRSGTNTSSRRPGRAGVGVIHQTDFVRLVGRHRAAAGLHPRRCRRLRQDARTRRCCACRSTSRTCSTRRYYATADGNNNISPGSPRAIRGVIRAKLHPGSGARSRLARKARAVVWISAPPP